MSFLEREYNKLMELCQGTPQGETYNALYAAKQALAWALEPNAFASPSAQIARHYNLPIAGTVGTGITLPIVATALAADVPQEQG